MVGKNAYKQFVTCATVQILSRKAPPRLTFLRHFFSDPSSLKISKLFIIGHFIGVQIIILACFPLQGQNQSS